MIVSVHELCRNAHHCSLTHQGSFSNGLLEKSTTKRCVSVDNEHKILLAGTETLKLGDALPKTAGPPKVPIPLANDLVKMEPLNH